jgi:hypothetical protein
MTTANHGCHLAGGSGGGGGGVGGVGVFGGFGGFGEFGSGVDTASAISNKVRRICQGPFPGVNATLPPDALPGVRSRLANAWRVGRSQGSRGGGGLRLRPLSLEFVTRRNDGLMCSPLLVRCRRNAGRLAGWGAGW